MVLVAKAARWLGNKLYACAFPVYRPLYRAFKSHADRPERKLLKECLVPGAVVVDAGANIGIYSEFLAQCVGPDGVVHSFEPDAKNFSRLQRELGDVPNVRLNQMAVGDETGKGTLFISEKLNVDHRAYATAGEERRAVSISTTRLDDYFAPGERVDLIKMDIQGFELHALRGAARVLSDNRDAKILLEFWPYGLRAAGGSPQALLAFLRERELVAYRIEDSQLLEYEHSGGEQDNPDVYFNLFVRRRENDGPR